MSSPSSSSATTTEEITKVKEETNREGSRSVSPIKKTVIESRRAEQNRAAQRAFRQRKERYVKELEAKVNSMVDWPARMEHLESENEALKRKINELLADQEQQQQQESNKKKMFSSGSKLVEPISTTKSNNSKSSLVPQKVVGEKGRVLDDLVSILRTRHRPPIPSHPPN
ncbi:hypothetical protein BD770DRAFT_401733 [Pilaira anomala]|nr:hypothetical protein BD770DRAFT_401733 [Pilaira anomala]